MKKKNTSSNPNYQKIVIKVSNTESSTKDLLAFDFYDESGNSITVNDIFDKVLEMPSIIGKLKDSIKEMKTALEDYKTAQNAIDKLILEAQDLLSKKVAINEKDISDLKKRMSNAETNIIDLKDKIKNL